MSSKSVSNSDNLLRALVTTGFEATRPTTERRPAAGADTAAVRPDTSQGALPSLARGLGDMARTLWADGFGDLQLKGRALALGAMDAAAGGMRTAGTAAVALNTATPANPVKRQITFTFDAGPHNQLSNLKLRGSWDASGKYSQAWDPNAIAMRNVGNGKWEATVEILDDGQPRDWQWGVTADGPQGKDQWAVMGEGNLKFSLEPNKDRVSYSPTTYHSMGARKDGADATFKFWAPNAQDVVAKVVDKDGNVQRFDMQRESDGTWSTRVKDGWANLEGKSYSYEVTGSDGVLYDRFDPYSLEMQGEQRGTDRIHLDPTSGKEVNRYTPGAMEMMRFEVDEAETAHAAYLRFTDDSGRQLTRDELIQRLGSSDTSLVDKLREGKVNDHWLKNVEADGRISMTNIDGAWSTLVNDPAKLEGLRYEIEVWDKDEQGNLKLRGDKDGSSKLSTAEREATHYNDKWDNLITNETGVGFRNGIITDISTGYQRQYDNAPREKDPSKWVVYQAHVGSFLGSGQNTNRSTFEDMINKLDHFKELGINTIELLPTNEVEGARNWGYLGVNTLAQESSLGFEDDKGNWVTGREALKRFIDEAHKRGLNVISDVVYNHVHGDHNDMWNVDGPSNPYFNWSKDPSTMEQRDTPWGAVPAYHQEKVKQFFVDHAVQQVQDLGFDGLRFDFTEPIKGAGGKEGWELLREINRQVHFYKPDTFTIAEQFDYDPSISRPAKADGTGGGFDAQWYSEFQHLLVADHGGREGLIQAAARGRKTNMDGFMNMLTQPRGLDEWKKALSMISNHDEVGNEARTTNQAEGDFNSDFPNQWARNAARFAAGIGMTSPGIPMFFQGDESLAQNEFRWGNPSTWDTGWKWQDLGKNWDWDKLTFNDGQKANYERLLSLPPEQRANDAGYKSLSAADKQVFDDLAKMKPEDQRGAMLDIARKQNFRFYKEAIALRNSSPAFAADGEVKRVYTHNDNSIMAYSRKSGDEEYIVIGSLNRNNFEGYGLELPPGQWKEVFNSDASIYGGNNFGNNGAAINGGNTSVNIPAGGYIVLKKQ